MIVLRIHSLTHFCSSAISFIRRPYVLRMNAQNNIENISIQPSLFILSVHLLSGHSECALETHTCTLHIDQFSIKINRYFISMAVLVKTISCSVTQNFISNKIQTAAAVFCQRKYLLRTTSLSFWTWFRLNEKFPNNFNEKSFF